MKGDGIKPWEKCGRVRWILAQKQCSRQVLEATRQTEPSVCGRTLGYHANFECFAGLEIISHSRHIPANVLLHALYPSLFSGCDDIMLRGCPTGLGTVTYWHF
ncbi:Ca2+:H+ antiporter [Fusarium oxysporum f. sp. albedinis]|nr:Ca2+:H+ antiporter [Fusarium oxysporum f. sp. albedinis]